MAKKHKHRKKRSGSTSPKNGPVEIYIRTKGKPRGKPFPKGKEHTIGMSFRFKKGNQAATGNVKCKQAALVSDTSYQLLTHLIPDDADQRTFVEGILQKLASRALYTGDRACAAELFDRAEGKPQQSIAVTSESSPLLGILDELKNRSKQIGPPEGFIPKKDRS